MVVEEKERTRLYSAMGVWNTFIQSTGLHGINKVAFSPKETKKRCLFWALLVISTSTYSIYTVIYELMNYWQYPAFVIPFPVSSEEMKFPAITICNLNALNNSAIKDDPRNHMFYLKISAVFQFFSDSDFSLPEFNWTDPFYLDNQFFDNMTKEDILMENKNILDSMVVSALFDYRFLDIKTFFTTRITPIGPCLTSKPDMLLKTRQSGPHYNYIITLNLDKAENYYGNYPGEGAQLMVHDPDVDPDMNTHVGKYFLSPGTDVYAEISKKEFQYLGYPYESMPGIYCRKNTAEGLIYNQGGCLKDCVASSLYGTCGCITFSHNNEVYCSKYKRATCVNRVIVDLLEKSDLRKECDCPIPCSDSRYHVSMTSVPAPSDFYVNNIQYWLENKTLRQQKEDTIVVHIYFNELSTFILKQIPKYSGIGDIFAKLGGQMGLFLGASIISIVEIGDLCLCLLCLCCEKKHQVTNEEEIQ